MVTRSLKNRQMEGLKYIPDKKFECNVELTGAEKFYVWDGVSKELPCKETEPLQCNVSFSVPTRMKELSYRADIAAAAQEAIVITPQTDRLTQIIFVRDTLSAVSSRVRINCRESGEYNIVLCYHTNGNHEYSTEEQMEIIVSGGAKLDLVIMQNEGALSNHNTDFKIRVEKDSLLSMNLITLHAGKVSNKIHTLLSESGGQCNLNGLYLADGKQVIDTKITLLHDAPECASAQMFKGILSGEAKSKFEGTIVVTPKGQKTEAYQANNNLLTSESARASSDPRLVIYADDVKCSHGSTCGSVGDEEIFYMRSRGISEAEARILQQQAFAGAVLDKVSTPELRERISRLVERRLRGEDIVCAGCGKRCC